MVMGVRVGRGVGVLLEERVGMELEERVGMEGGKEAGRAVPEGVEVGACLTGVVPVGEVLLLLLLEIAGADELTPLGFVCS